ncbi:unnamed protein product [Rhizophagus irregularis]|nr:unnamed protein product [Rhizophagus irregularis]
MHETCRLGGLPKYRNFKDLLDSRVTSEEWKKPSFISSKFAEEWENSKIQSGGFPKKEKSRNQDSIWQASEEWKTKKPRFVISGRLLKNENPKIRSGGFLKNENPKIKIRRLLKNENPKIHKFGRLPCGKTKIRSVGF